MKPGSNTHLLVVRASGLLMGLPLTAVSETLRRLPCTPVGGVPPFVLGLSLVRGSPTPVVDLGRALGHGAGTSLGRWVTVRAGARPVALAVDAVVGVRRLDPDAMTSLPPLVTGASDQIVALAVLDRELLTVLEAGRLVGDEVLSLGEAS